MPDPEGMAKALREPLLKVFPPALLGRLVAIPYYPLSDDMMARIVRLQLARIQRRVQERYPHPLRVRRGSGEARGVALHRVRERRPGDRRHPQQHRASEGFGGVPAAPEPHRAAGSASGWACTRGTSATNLVERLRTRHDGNAVSNEQNREEQRCHWPCPIRSFRRQNLPWTRCPPLQQALYVLKRFESARTREDYLLVSRWWTKVRPRLEHTVDALDCKTSGAASDVDIAKGVIDDLSTAPLQLILSLSEFVLAFADRGQRCVARRIEGCSEEPGG